MQCTEIQRTTDYLMTATIWWLVPTYVLFIFIFINPRNTYLSTLIQHSSKWRPYQLFLNIQEREKECQECLWNLWSSSMQLNLNMKIHAEAEIRKGKNKQNVMVVGTLQINWCFLRLNVLSTSGCCNYFITLCNNLWQILKQLFCFPLDSLYCIWNWILVLWSLLSFK